MLVSITIRNIALIESLTIPFHSGMHVLTGETGAGKSIVVDAVNLVLGGRADRDLIRTGCDKAYVEAVFDIADNPGAQKFLMEQQIETEGGLLTVSREISQSGRNICRIMGMGMQLSVLKQLTAMLMDIHGQHEHQFLMDPKFHLAFLDEFGDQSHKALLQELETSFHAFMECHREYIRLRKAAGEREQRLDMLRFQCQELQNAQLKPGEEEELSKERDMIRHSEKINGAMECAYEALYGEGENAVSRVREAAEALKPIAAYNPGYEQMAQRLESLYFELEDAGITLRDWSERDSFDPEDAQRVEERLDLITRLCRKYGPETSDVLKHQQEIEQELAELEALDDSLEYIQNEHKKKLKAYRAKAQAVTLAREALARLFEKQMTLQLSQLGMARTQFEVAFHKLPLDAKKPMPTAVGDDQIEFMIAPNPGEPLKPLAKIASGGELSRLMLAIKAIAAQSGKMDSMVFDEIDTGISGRMAQVVAEKMMSIAKYNQVICVTHLPQIAAMADHQYLVEKTVERNDKGEERTHTRVVELDKQQRAELIARMIGGADQEAEESVQYAMSLIEAAELCKLT